MNLNIDEIKLFESLLEFKWGDRVIDLHNDLQVCKVTFLQDILILYWYEEKSSSTFLLTCLNTKIVRWEISLKVDESGILDQLYRGRYIINGTAVENDEIGRGYFYLTFTDGFRIEFLCSSLVFEKVI